MKILSRMHLLDPLCPVVSYAANLTRPFAANISIIVVDVGVHVEVIDSTVRAETQTKILLRCICMLDWIWEWDRRELERVVQLQPKDMIRGRHLIHFAWEDLILAKLLRLRSIQSMRCWPAEIQYMEKHAELQGLTLPVGSN